MSTQSTPKPLDPAALMEYTRLLAIGTQRGPAHGDGHALREAAREIAQLRARTAKMATALMEIQGDFSKHGQSVSNYSDGEYTQDYTTRRERIETALKP